MSLKRSVRSVYRGFRRALRVVARPARRDRGLRGVVIQSYRGYGTKEEVYFMGRVFRQPRMGARIASQTVFRDVVDVIRRFTRFGLGEVELTARFAGAEKRVQTDRDGYFHVLLHPRDTPPDRLWHDVEIELTYKGESARDVAEVLIPPSEARFVVISDIDDTVMRTGVANTAVMLYRLFVQGAESRTAFPGVAALYRALHRGASGHEHNLMLYVSRAPWSIYEVLEQFFQLHRIPIGPVLFLREWGLTLQRPLPKRAKDHKRDLIADMLKRYGDLPFVLIGDSGQHDPEVYAEAVRRYPGRVLAVYIRDVSLKDRRTAEIDELAREIEKAGSTLVLASDTLAMARHAVEHGLMSPDDLPGVAAQEDGVETVPDVAEAGLPDVPAENGVPVR